MFYKIQYFFISKTKGFSLHGFSLRQVDVFVLDVVQVGDKLERESKNLCYFLTDGCNLGT